MKQLYWIPIIFLAIAIAGILGGAGAISLGKFGDTVDKCDTTGAVWNESQQKCVNASNHSQTLGDTTAEWETILQSQSGIKTVGEQMPTVSIIAIMVVIIAILSAIFVYFRWFR